ncbi:MAG: pyruvate kinase alpha/beta domain-containing protein, partial [Desulfococcaceae bacterium]
MRFPKAGKSNTDETLRLAEERRRALDIQEVVVASTTGDTAYKALELFSGAKIVVVTYHCGFREPFQNVMDDQVKLDLAERGATVVAATHALSGVERAVAKKHSGVYPALLIADTLRLFGQGVKVAVEIAVMAADSGALSGADIVAVGGTGRGADAALVLKPAN